MEIWGKFRTIFILNGMLAVEGFLAGLSMGMGFPRESHGKCPMGGDGMEQHELQFPWDMGTSTEVIV